MNLKGVLKKFWHLLWKDNSLKGWIFSIVFLFIFVKFIFFPILNFATGTSLPLAIVESCSMYHKHNPFYTFDGWWENHKSKYSELGISKEQFLDYPLKNGFNKGDILFIIGVKPEKLKIGDGIVFIGGQKNPITHRIIKIESKNGGYTFSTMGDNNNGQLVFEKEIKENQIIGKIVFRLVPYAGWGKLIFYEPFRAEAERGFCSQN
ncbi:MAG: signal peptidase I [Nanoarchaeota archaeon]|nr:signal peptidase I [Nanoarchaeota archaeon]